MSQLTKSCKYCCAEIPSGANLCKECNCYQSSVRNQLTLLAGLGGMIALLTYLTASLGEVRKNILWKDNIEIVSVAPKTGYVIRNSGDGDVFIEGVRYEYKGSSGVALSTSTAIGEIVSPGKTIRHVIPEESERAEAKPILSNKSIPKIESFDQALRLSIKNKECLRRALFSTDSIYYKNYFRSMKDSLIQMPVEATIVYFSRTSAPMEKTFSGVLVFVFDPDNPECKTVFAAN